MAQIVMAKSDSGLQIALHPLVLLTISDYITRHTLRQQKTPIVGALLGQQNGRQTTVEHAFECKVNYNPEPELDAEWFEVRLQQMKDVHKAPVLDLVGWYTTTPTSGPQKHHMPIQLQFSNFYPECSLLLGFHPTDVLEPSVGGKLPLNIYETTVEPVKPGETADVLIDEDAPAVKVTYKEVPYTVETGEAEMIGIDFVARGGGNATAVPSTMAKQEAPLTKGRVSKGKGMVTNQGTSNKQADNDSYLSKEDEELIASLTAKSNAIKMLRSRINLITAYLEQLPNPAIESGLQNISQPAAPVDHTILRSIQALLNRLSLLVPSNSTAFNEELLAEQNDVNLVNLLSTMMESIKGARETGRKFQIVESARVAGGKKATQNGHFADKEFLTPEHNPSLRSIGAMFQ